MNKQTVVIGIIVVIALVGIGSYYVHAREMTVVTSTTATALPADPSRHGAGSVFFEYRSSYAKYRKPLFPIQIF